LKFVRRAFGWDIYKLTELKEECQRDEYTVEYYIAVKPSQPERTPIEGKKIGDVLEKIADVESKIINSPDTHDDIIFGNPNER
jgi:hypothetical protein